MVPTNYLKYFRDSVMKGEPMIKDSYGDCWVLKQWFCYKGDINQYVAHCNPENEKINGEWRNVGYEDA